MRRRRRGAAPLAAASRSRHGKTHEAPRGSRRGQRTAILITGDSAWARVLETGLRNLGYRVLRIAPDDAWKGALARTDVRIVVVDKQAARSRWSAWSRGIASVRAGVNVFVIGAPRSACSAPGGMVWITGPDPAANVLQRLLEAQTARGATREECCSRTRES